MEAWPGFADAQLTLQVTSIVLAMYNAPPTNIEPESGALEHVFSLLV